MAEETVAVGEGIDRAVAHGLKLFFVAFQKQRASTVAHVLTGLVEIWSGYILATAYGHTVVALYAPAAVIPTYEQILVAAVPEDEWCLDGIGSGKTRSWVGFGRCVTYCMPTGYGEWLIPFLDVHGTV